MSKCKLKKLEQRVKDASQAHTDALDEACNQLALNNEEKYHQANIVACEKEQEFRRALTELDTARRELDPATDEGATVETDATVTTGDTFSGLVKRCEVRNYIQSAISENPLSGPEAELNQHLHGNAERGALGGVRIPWRLLAPEQRADVPSSLPTGAGPSSERDFIGRVFRNSVTDFLGIRTEQVPAGESTYTILTDGATADQLAPSAEKESVAATLSKIDLNPKRLVTRYTVRVEDLHRSNLYEMGLREDMANVLRQRVDDLVVNGNGNAPQPTGLLAELPAPTGSVTNRATYSDYLMRISSVIDGLYANSLPQLRLLVNPDAYAYLVQTYRSNEDSMAVLDWVMKNTGGIRASAHMPTVTNSNVGRILIHKTGGGDMSPNACAAFWNSPELIRDVYTNAGRGEVHLTLMQLWDFAVLREAAWSQKRVKLS